MKEGGEAPSLLNEKAKDKWGFRRCKKVKKNTFACLVFVYGFRLFTIDVMFFFGCFVVVVVVNVNATTDLASA